MDTTQQLYIIETTRKFLELADSMYKQYSNFILLEPQASDDLIETYLETLQPYGQEIVKGLFTSYHHALSTQGDTNE